MKKIYSLLMAIACAAMTFTSCSIDNEPFASASEDDFPQILLPWFGEFDADGNPSEYKNFIRTEEYVDSVTVTPAKFTTVEWFIDEEKVGEGLKYRQFFIAGTYRLKIVATTTKGLSTKREGMITVRPAEGDPSVVAKAKNLYCQTGTTKTMDGANLTGIKHVYIGGTEASNVSSTDDALTFDVPSMADGEYNLVVETADMKYGCGKVTVSAEKWVEPGVEEVDLFSGATDINWGDSNVNVDMSQVPAGTTVHVYYEMVDMPDGYHAMRITTPQWGDNPEDNVIQQFDLTADTPNPFTFEYTQANKDICDARGGMLIVGYGYKVTGVTYEKMVAGAETTIWEGDTDINWGESNINISEALAKVAVGKTIVVYYDIIDMPDGYHAMRITTPQWGDNAEDNLVQQFDLTGETPNPYTFEYTDHCKELCDGRGGMLIVGYGYKVTKVAVK